MTIAKNINFVIAAIKRNKIAALAAFSATAAYGYLGYYHVKHMPQIIADWKDSQYQFPARTESLIEGAYASYKYWAIYSARFLLPKFIDAGLDYMFANYINIKWLGCGAHAGLSMRYISQNEQVDTRNIMAHTTAYALGIKASLLLSIDLCSLAATIYNFYQQAQPVNGQYIGFNLFAYALSSSAVYVVVNVIFNKMEVFLSKKTMDLQCPQSNLLAFNMQNPLQVQVNQATLSKYAQLQLTISNQLKNLPLPAAYYFARTYSNVFFSDIICVDMLRRSIPNIVEQPKLVTTIRQLAIQCSLINDGLSGIVGALINSNTFKQAAARVIHFDDCTTNYQNILKARQFIKLETTEANLYCDFSVTYPGQKKLFTMQYTFERGNIYALSGNNGTGKSSFLNSLYGINPYCSGKITVPPQENFIYISQSIALKPGLNFKDTLLHPEKFDDLDAELCQYVTKIIRELVNTFAMQDKMFSTSERWIENLSRGELQRFAAMQAIVKMLIKSKVYLQESAPEHVVLLIDGGLNVLNPDIKKTVFEKLRQAVAHCNATCITIDYSAIPKLQEMYGKDFIVDFNELARDTTIGLQT